MRAVVAFLGILVAGPAVAGPLTACDFIGRAEVEKMLGEPVAPPNVTDMNICAGLCAGTNVSRCDFTTTAEPEGKRRKFQLEVLLPPYEFSGRSERGIFEADRDEREAVQDIPGLGAGAFWYDRYDIRQSLFFAYPKRELHLMVQEINVERHAALENAAAATALAIKRYEALPKARRAGAFEFETVGGTYPWRP